MQYCNILQYVIILTYEIFDIHDNVILLFDDKTIEADRILVTMIKSGKLKKLILVYGFH